LKRSKLLRQQKREQQQNKEPSAREDLLTPQACTVAATRANDQSKKAEEAKKFALMEQELLGSSSQQSSVDNEPSLAKVFNYLGNFTAAPSTGSSSWSILAYVERLFWLFIFLAPIYLLTLYTIFLFIFLLSWITSIRARAANYEGLFYKTFTTLLIPIQDLFNSYYNTVYGGYGGSYGYGGYGGYGYGGYGGYGNMMGGYTTPTEELWVTRLLRFLIRKIRELTGTATSNSNSSSSNWNDNAADTLGGTSAKQSKQQQQKQQGEEKDAKSGNQTLWSWLKQSLFGGSGSGGGGFSRTMGIVLFAALLLFWRVMYLRTVYKRGAIMAHMATGGYSPMFSEPTTPEQYMNERRLFEREQRRPQHQYQGGGGDYGLNNSRRYYYQEEGAEGERNRDFFTQFPSQMYVC